MSNPHTVDAHADTEALTHNVPDVCPEVMWN